MSNRENRPFPSYTLPIVCILLFLGLLGVGLWPFDPFPPNQVAWLPGSGLEFGGQGVVHSSGLIDASSGQKNSACSLRIRLQPQITDLNNSATLLTFYTPENPMQFRLMQYRDELLIRRDFHDHQNRLKTIELELERTFVRDEPVTYTVTTGTSGGSAAYRNGVRVGDSPRMGLSCADFSGQLVLGDSPVMENAWKGKLLELAIYNRALSPEEIAREDAKDAKGDQSTSDGKVEPRKTLDDKNVIAHYEFAEGSDKVIRNSAGPAPDLYIPSAFRILHKRFLMAPWEETADKVALRDIVINIGGFVPFGFLCFACLRRHRERRRAIILTVLAGLAVSLTIEVLQYIVPPRSSDMIDLVTNTLGTYLGAALFLWPRVQNWALKFRLLRVPGE
jgi:VanZ like family/Concanavalin A-like lectin/glucanases superfamily